MYPSEDRRKPCNRPLSGPKNSKLSRVEGVRQLLGAYCANSPFQKCIRPRPFPFECPFNGLRSPRRVWGFLIAVFRAEWGCFDFGVFRFRAHSFKNVAKDVILINFEDYSKNLANDSTKNGSKWQYTSISDGRIFCSLRETPSSCNHVGSLVGSHERSNLTSDRYNLKATYVTLYMSVACSLRDFYLIEKCLMRIIRILTKNNVYLS